MQGSHEWLCKQPKRKGTFPLAESAVKRFPATVIAAFGGIISVVLWAEEGRMWDGKERHRRWVLCLMTKWEPGAKGEVPVHYDWSFDQHPGSQDAHHMGRAPSEGSQWEDFFLLCVVFVPIIWIPPFMVFTAAASCWVPEICTWKGLVNSDFSELSISYMMTQSNPGSQRRNFWGKCVKAWKPSLPEGSDSGMSLEDFWDALAHAWLQLCSSCSVPCLRP